MTFRTGKYQWSQCISVEVPVLLIFLLKAVVKLQDLTLLLFKFEGIFVMADEAGFFFCDIVTSC